MVKILLADPDPAVRGAFQILLQRKLPGSHLEQAANLEELLQQINSCKPDLLLFDWRLPGLEEVSLQDWAAGGERMLVVGMSIQAEDRCEVMKSGAHAFLYKGENPERVIQELKTLLARIASQQDQTASHTDFI